MRSEETSRKPFRRGVAINPAALKEARLDRGLSLAEVAQGIVSRQALQQFEAGKARPIRTVLAALATRLELPVEALLARPHDPREVAMRELAERHQWRRLESVAAAILSDMNITPRTQAIARYYLGRAAVDQAPNESLAHLRQARGQLARVGEPRLAAEAREWEGAALYLMQDANALDVGRDALARYRLLADRDPAVEARMLEHIGTYQLQREQLSDAVGSYHQAIDVAGNVLNLVRLANIYHGLASAYLRLQQPRRALEYFERAVGFARTHNDLRGTPTANLARLESDYGDLLIRTGPWERAEEMIQSALNHFTTAGVESGRPESMLSMGDLKHQQGHHDEAMTWTNDAIAMADRLGETVTLAAGYEQLGALYAVQRDFDRCDAAFSRAVELFDRAGLPERRKQALEHYRRIMESVAEPHSGN